MADSVLQTIVTRKKECLRHVLREHPLATWKASVQALTGFPFEAALQLGDDVTTTRLILEIKPASPSAGVLQANLNLDTIVSGYNTVASAMSVLTDADYFGGSFELLEQVHQHTTFPLLCKDFIIDPYQVYQARQAGAAAVLLIVKSLMLDDLHALHQQIIELGMTPVVEIQNEAELDTALQVHPKVILINNRNLDTLVMDMTTVTRLAPLIPKNILTIGASGIETAEDIQQFKPLCQRFLIGSSVMRLADQPALFQQKLQELAHA